MISLAAALDATALIWSPDGSERRMPVLDLVTDVQTTALAHGELLRSIEIPREHLGWRTGYRKLALSPLGRSGTLVIARLGVSGQFVVTVTAATTRPRQLRFDEIPTADQLDDEIGRIDNWYDDAHGAPDWRAAMTALLAEQLRVELGAVA